MKSQKITTKSGKTMLLPVLDQEAISIGDMDGGWCLNCGIEVDGVEPDARAYTCEVCGERRVYGFEELMLMGLTR